MGYMGNVKAAASGEPNEACEQTFTLSNTGADGAAAFVSAAASSAQNKPSALQKSRAVIGLGGQGKDSSAAIARDRKGDDGSLKVGEVSRPCSFNTRLYAHTLSYTKPP